MLDDELSDPLGVLDPDGEADTFGVAVEVVVVNGVLDIVVLIDTDEDCDILCDTETVELSDTYELIETIGVSEL
jgi:hypothetical protein